MVISVGICCGNTTTLRTSEVNFLTWIRTTNINQLSFFAQKLCSREYSPDEIPFPCNFTTNLAVYMIRIEF